MKRVIEVSNRIRVPKEGCEEALRVLVEEHTYANPDYAKAKARSKWGVPKRIPKTLQTWDEESHHVTFSRGSLERVKEVLTAEHVDFETLGVICLGDPELRAELEASPLASSVRLRPFQEDQVAVGVTEPLCLWRAPAGSGKTTSTLAYIAELNLPAIIVVPSAQVFAQWVRRLETQLGLKTEDIGMLGGGIKRIRPITVAMQQTLVNTGSDYAKTFGVYAADEVQLHGASTFSAVSDESCAHFRLGVSADERRADGKEFLIYDLFGKVKHEVYRADLIRDGFIHDAEIRVVPTSTVLSWYDKLPPKKRADANAQNRLHTELASDEGRNELIRGVLRWCMDAEELTLLLAWRREHCHSLGSLATEMGYKCGIMLGGSDQRDDFEHSRIAMEAGQLNIVAGTYQAIGIGFDMPALSRGIMAAACANNAKAKYQFGQYTGRFERIFGDKKGAIIYYIWDENIFGERPLRNLMRWRTKVRVLCGERWVSGKEYLNNSKKAEDLDGLLA